MLHWNQLCRLSEAELGARDIAETNLACAEGLPGAEKINHFECIDRLNHYGRCAADYTERRMLDFYEKAEIYDNSPAKFRIVCMITLLQRQFGVRYNPAKKPADAVFDTEDTFIHGALIGQGGTCASLPVVWTAVGRRLGYPLRLVSCKQHLFVRWDEPGGERFNIEVNDTSVGAPPDDHYRTGLFATTPDLEKRFCLLQSMTPRMELAAFLASRGRRWFEIKQYKEAADSFLWAAALVPQTENYSDCVKATLMMWRERLWEMIPPGFPTFNVSFPSERRFPESLTLEVEHQFIRFESLEKCLLEPTHQQWWTALRRSNGVRPQSVPRMISLRVPV